MQILLALEGVRAKSFVKGLKTELREGIHWEVVPIEHFLKGIAFGMLLRAPSALVSGLVQSAWHVPEVAWHSMSPFIVSLSPDARVNRTPGSTWGA